MVTLLHGWGKIFIYFQLDGFQCFSNFEKWQVAKAKDSEALEASKSLDILFWFWTKKKHNMIFVDFRSFKFGHRNDQLQVANQITLNVWPAPFSTLEDWLSFLVLPGILSRSIDKNLH